VTPVATPVTSARPAARIAAGPPTAICDANFVTCLNAWNGGPSVYGYAPGVANDYFSYQGINLCNTSPADYSTATCPFYLGSGLNQPGYYIYQWVDKRNGKCVGDNGSNWNATEVGCNNSGGTGGGYGTVEVYGIAGGCSSGGVGVNREWSDHYDNYEEAGWGSGHQAVLSSSSGGVCWLRFN
jgi:hypothetical protein